MTRDGVGRALRTPRRGRLQQNDMASPLSYLDDPECRETMEESPTAEAFLALRHGLGSELSFEIDDVAIHAVIAVVDRPHKRLMGTGEDLAGL